MWETATNDRETRGYLKLIDDTGLINSCYANMTETEIRKRREVLDNILKNYNCEIIILTILY